LAAAKSSTNWLEPKVRLSVGSYYPQFLSLLLLLPYGSAATEAAIPLSATITGKDHLCNVFLLTASPGRQITFIYFC